MQGIENKIKQNIEAFNSSEPGKDHLSNFEAKLDELHAVEKESWTERFGLVIKIAAATLIFITIGTLYYTNSFSFLRGIISDQIVASELPLEVREVMQYYNVITDKKVDQIDELAVSADEAQRIKDMALLELKSLENDRIELEKEYNKHPNNERVMNALLINQQKKSEILDKILNTLNQVN